jgi:DNA polymerase III epsilon subunit-like protein
VTKFHVNVATGYSGKLTEEVRPHTEYDLHFDDDGEAERFGFLTQVSGSRPAGSLTTPEVTLAAQMQLKELIEAKDYSGLRALVNARTSAPVFRNALLRRAKLKAELDRIGVRLDKAKARTKLVNKKVAAKARIDDRTISLEFRRKYEELRFLWAQLDEYRVLNAQAALASSLLQEDAERAAGTFLEYTALRIGDMEALGEYESNSPEWHAARSAGIGGSDVGAIMRVDKEWASTNFSRVVNSKLGIEDPTNNFDRSDLRTGIGRGNAWEEYVRQTVALMHPELRVAFCKTSWHGITTPYRHANFDGLILDEAGTPEGVIEIKTGSDPTKWGLEELGLDGVPAGYRKQTLWYAMNAGLKYGKIVAIIDDHDYREYSFSMSDPKIQAELDEMVIATDNFWKDIQEKRVKLEAGELISRKRIRRGMQMTNDYDKLAEVYSGYAGITFEEAKQRLVDTIEAEKLAKGRLLTEEEFHQSAVKVFAQHNPAERVRPLIGVDLETTTTSPRTGRIIETGIARLNSDGVTEIVYSSMHDIPEEAKAGVGLGQYEIHRITAEMITGTPSFDEPDEQERILNFLKSGTLVAHNAGFEDRFFSANLPGYVEAKNNGEIIILDTQKLTSFLMPKSDDSSLQSFAEDNGVPYAGAHAATADAVMMMKALGRLQSSLYLTKTFKTKRITDAYRLRAQKSALKSDKER